MYTRKDRMRVGARRGFTLIELLVVIAIIALLVALTAGGVAAVLRAQVKAATEATISKLASPLDQQWQAVIDQAGDEFQGGKVPAGFTQTWGGNPDQAKKLWINLRLRQEFPTNFTEARNGPSYQGFALPPKQRYLRTINGLSGSPQFESSVCLVMALTAARRGMNFSIEDAVGASGVRDLNGGKVVLDGYGEPIGIRIIDKVNFALEPEIFSPGPDKAPGTFDDLKSTNLRSAGARGDK